MSKMIKKLNPRIIFLVGVGIALIYLTGYLGNGEYFNNHTAFGYGGGGGGAAPTPAIVTAMHVPLSISSTQEGKLIQGFTDNAKAEVQVPLGAVAAYTTFNAGREDVALSSKPAASTGASVVGDKIFNIFAKDALGTAVKNFSLNLTVTLSVPNLPADTSKLGAYYLDAAGGSWVKIAGATFDQPNNKVTFTINHLTLFAVIEAASLPDTLAISGGAVTVTPEAAVTLLKTASDTKVYLIQNNQRRWISSLEAFKAGGYKWSDVKIVDSATLNQYPEGASISVAETPIAAQLLKTASDTKVYLIQNNQRRWISSLEAFKAGGYKWSDVKIVDSATLSQYAEGAQISVSEAPAAYVFKRYLGSGSEGTDVKQLQLILISKNTGPAAQALAKIGATSYFGKLTQQALAEYQASVGITPAIGYFGSKTKIHFNAM